MVGKIGSLGEAAARERKFYIRMAWFLVALVFIGFAPSFYLKPLGLSYPRPNPPLIANLLLHGTVFTAWMAIFLAQVSLVAAAHARSPPGFGRGWLRTRRGDDPGDVLDGGMAGRTGQPAALYRFLDLVD